MRKFIPNPILTRTLLLGLVFLFLGVTKGYSQYPLDGNYDVAEYEDGQSLIINPTASGTCEVGEVFAVVKDTIVLIGFQNGNAGNAIFRYYFNIDPDFGLEYEVFKGDTVFTNGADMVLQLQANDGSTLEVFQLDSVTQTWQQDGNGITAMVGDYDPSDGKFIEIMISLGESTFYNVCDLENDGAIDLATYVSFSGGSTKSNPCYFEIVGFTINLNGAVTSDEEFCIGENTSHTLSLSGEWDEIVRWESSTDSLLWSPISNTSSSYTTPSNLIETTYYRAIIKGSLCDDIELESSTAKITLEECCTETVSASALDSSVCEDETISLNATFSDGTNYNSITWNGPNGFSSLAKDTTFDALSIAASGDYIVTVYYGDGCVAVDTVNVIVYALPTAVITQSHIELTCDTSSINLDAATNDASYLWSTGSTDPDIDVTTIGEYSVIVTDLTSGCMAYDTVTIGQDVNTPTAVITQSHIEFTCDTTSINLDAATNDASYLWSTGSTDPDIEVTTIGEYSVIVTDLTSGCMAYDTVTIGQDVNTPTAVITQSHIEFTCDTSSINLDAATNDASYLWSTGSTDPDIDVTTIGEYSVIVTDLTSGCMAYDTVTIGQDINTPTAVITQSHIEFTCDTSSINLDAATNDASYLWSTGSTDPDIDVTTIGEYSVIVTDLTSGCMAYDTVTIGQDINTPTAVITQSHIELTCDTTSINLDAATNDASYLWSTGSTDPDIDVTTIGEYSVIVTDLTSGCMAYDTVTIGQDINTPTAVITQSHIELTCDTSSINLDAATNDASYLWSTGSTDPDIDVTTIGEYSVIVTDLTSGCMAYDTVTIGQDVNTPTAVITQSHIELTCDTSSINLDAATNDASYLWSTGSTDPDIEVTTIGEYSVIVTDLTSGCMAYDTVTIGQDINTPTAVITQSHIEFTCDTTSINLDAATNDASYLWSTGSTDPDIEVTTIGEYSVIVTDLTSGCMAYDTVTIGQDINTPTAVITQSHIEFTCDTTSINLDAATNDASYLWSTGSTDPDIEVTTIGEYSVIVTDLTSGCMAYDTVTIGQDINTPTAVITQSHIEFTCDTTSINLDAATNDASYLWSTGSTDPDIEVTTIGEYSVIVTDLTSGCMAYDTVTIGQDINTPTAVITQSHIEFTCDTTSINLDAATNDASYLWSTGSTDPDIEVTTIGEYSVIVTDLTSGCMAYDTVTIGQDINTPTAVITQSHIEFTCDTSSINLDAATNDASYLWSTGSTDPDIDVTTIGEYSVIVTDLTSGCMAYDTVTIGQDINTPTAVITQSHIEFTCDTTSINLDAATNDASYLWSTGSTDPDIDVTTIGEYSVIVTDLTSGCMAYDTVTIGQDINTPTAVITQSHIELTCDTTSINLDAATNDASYLWSTGSTDPDIDVTTIGEYSVIVTDLTSGCMAYDTVTIGQDINTPTAVITQSHIEFTCDTSSINLDAATNDASYLWSTGSTDPDIDVTTIGEYSVIVTDLTSGCMAYDTVTIGQDINTPTAVITQSHIEFTCDTSSINLDAATNDASYLWSTGSTDPDIDVTTIGEYSVIVTDLTSGCMAYDTVTIGQDINTPTAVITQSHIELTCDTSSINLDAATNDASYLWSTGSTDPDIDVTTIGEYSVIVTDLTSGCMAYDTVTIGQDVNTPTAVITQSHIEFTCDTSSINLDAATNDASYLWSTGSTDPDIDVTTIGEYSVIVTDLTSGCMAYDTVTIGQDVNTPTAVIIGSLEICSNEQTILDASSSITQESAIYAWFKDNSLLAGQIGDTLVVTESGDYTVEITDSRNGCTNTDTVTVKVNELPILEELIADVEECDSYELPELPEGFAYYAQSMGVEPVSGPITEDSTIYVFAATGTDNLCWAEDTFNVVINTTPSIKPLADVEECDSYELPELPDGFAYYAQSMGVEPVSGTITEDSTIFVFAATGTDNLCWTEDTFNVSILKSTEATIDTTVCDELVINGETFTSNDTYIQNLTNAAGCDSTLTINLTVLESTSSRVEVAECDSYTWNGTTYNESGTYTFETTNAAGCDSVATLVLTILESGEQTITRTECNSYTFNGTTYNESGTYTIITENNNGCTLTTTLNLTILETTYGTDTQTVCKEFTWIDGNTYTENNNTATYTIENAAGCDSIVTLNLTILDPIELTSEASDLTVECDGLGNTAEFENWLLSNGATGTADVGVGDITWSNDYEGLTSGCGNTGETTVTFTAMDECGNTVSTTATFRIEDTTAPDVICNDITVQLDANGVASISVDDIDGGTTDNCGGIDTIFISQENFYCENLGENVVTLTAIDECGNVSTCTATVTVEQGEYDCGVQPFNANDDILTLIYCPGGTVSGSIDLFANDEGFTRENVSFNILTDLPDGVSVTDGELLYVNEAANEAVLTFTYSVCHTVNTENCDTAEVTIHVLLDTDCDGIPNRDDIDDDDDGILDIIEEENALNQTTLDSDGDGIVDRLDIDSDNDGIPDNIEWQQNIEEGILYGSYSYGTDMGYDYYPPLGTDENSDGWDDRYDRDGFTYEPVDMDGDGTPDYLDIDSDGDGLEDWIEGWDAAPHDTIADTDIGATDSDGDGLFDNYDSYDTSEEWLHGLNAIGSFAPLQDMAADTANNIRDWRDVIEPSEQTPEPLASFPYIPDGFSPNQDSYNDYFQIVMRDEAGTTFDNFGEAFPDAKIEIYNRWGNRIYQKANYGNYNEWGTTEAWWDGTSMHDMQIGNDKLPTATYFYILYLNNGSEPITGSIFLNN
ncbi:gliding motility-associated C-terminal domain-containing protein [Draconibacterium halophilum]|uniref:Gliding motility-associated C-terminal domain-containing protein n=1 Tax=Draconibacterium halophilum TaxID=2706887 RepID=A0A6C0RH86_9BACT|nr:gliding motility-associated C-terminal domain-containing protein [Draconibacterium halophilum]QIA08903.1 gliding motility-associated C-terminal domain-containing protein [Draconibacterium halophilum]